MEVRRRENESLLSYFKRITDNILEYDLDYSEWIKLIIDKEYGSENARKMYYALKIVFEKLDNEVFKDTPDNKIQEMMQVLGEIECKKQELRNKQNKINKVKRDFVKSYEIANDMKQFIKENEFNIEKLNYSPILSIGDKKLIVCCGDWHVGYVIDNYKGNSYNYEIAKHRLIRFLYEINKVCSENNITDVIVVNLGDTIENCQMRDNQSYDCEFVLAEQIVQAKRLLYWFITEITNQNRNVTLYSLGGNHTRMAGNKDKNLEKDSSNIIINEGIRDMIELSNNNRIKIGEVDYKDDSAYFNLDGLNILAIHGDNRPSEPKKLFDSENSMNFNKPVNLILRGHFHNFNISSQNNGGMVITNNCLFGYNPYSIKRLSCNSNASQSLIVVDNGKVDNIKNVDLQIN